MTLTFWTRCDECNALRPADKINRLVALDGSTMLLCERCDPATDDELEEAGQLGIFNLSAQVNP